MIVKTNFLSGVLEKGIKVRIPDDVKAAIIWRNVTARYWFGRFDVVLKENKNPKPIVIYMLQIEILLATSILSSMCDKNTITNF